LANSLSTYSGLSCTAGAKLDFATAVRVAAREVECELCRAMTRCVCAPPSMLSTKFRTQGLCDFGYRRVRGAEGSGSGYRVVVQADPASRAPEQGGQVLFALIGGVVRYCVARDVWQTATERERAAPLSMRGAVLDAVVASQCAGQVPPPPRPLTL
jgi:hypothetical protein